MPDYSGPIGGLFNPLATNFLNLSFLGPPQAVYHARSGDVRYPDTYSRFDQILLTQIGLEPVLEVGKSKIVSIQEFNTERRAMITENRRYFNNAPPVINLDYEDPLRDMTRIVYGIARECILKGARFLVGKGRFDGLNAIDLQAVPQVFRDQLEKVWHENNLTQLLKQTTRTYLWAGDDIWKMNVEQQSSVTIDEIPTDPNEPLGVKEKVINTDIRFTRCNPEHFHAITNPNNGNDVICWVYQFEKPDRTYYREEIFKDMTLVYHGVRKKMSGSTSNNPIDILQNIPGSGFSKANMYTMSDAIVYTLLNSYPHKELDEFPLIVWRNNPDYGPYGISEFFGLHGKFDSLNGMVTRTMFAIDQLSDPVMVMSGTNFNPHNQVKAADNMWILPEKEAKLNIVQWDGNIDGVLKMIDLMATQVYRTVGVPKSSEMKAFTNVSGDALNIINTDIVDATNDRRLDLEDGLKRMIKLVRKSLKITKPLEDQVQVIWGPVFPESPKDKNQRLLSLSNAKIAKRKRVIQLDPTIPAHLKEEMINEADQLENQDRQDKLDAIAAQTQAAQGSGASGSGSVKRSVQRASGSSKERGPGKVDKSSSGKAPPRQGD